MEDFVNKLDQAVRIVVKEVRKYSRNKSGRGAIFLDSGIWIWKNGVRCEFEEETPAYNEEEGDKRGGYWISGSCSYVVEVHGIDGLLFKIGSEKGDLCDFTVDSSEIQDMMDIEYFEELYGEVYQIIKG